MEKNGHKRKWLVYLLTFCLILLGGTIQVSAASKVNLKNAEIRLSAGQFTYNKKVQRPKVTVTYKGKKLKEKKNYTVKYSSGCRNVGSYTIQIIGKGAYTGTVKRQFTILPPKTQIISASARKNGINVVVKKQTAQTSGYQLRYSTNSKLKNAKVLTVKGNKKTSFAIGSLKAGTTYYMQVRTYMTVKGKKYYSGWSVAISRKTTGKSSNTAVKPTPTKKPTPAPTKKPTPTPTTKPLPKLTFEEGQSSITLESGKYYGIETSNNIKDINISDETVVYSLGDKGNRYCDFETLEPGKCVITITDIYGQKITSTVQVTQKLYDPRVETSYEVKSETLDKSLPVPNVKSVDYGDEWIELNCPGTFSSSDAYTGYEGYLSYNNAFKESIQVSRCVSEYNGIGSISFYYLNTGRSYYVKVRSYTVRNNVKVVSPWSEIRKVDLPNYDKEGTEPARYTYEIYGLDKQKADIYTDCIKPLFIKTDNPDLNSFELLCNGKSPFVNVYSGGTTHIYEDIPYENDDSETSSLKKVKGGYIGYVRFSEAGTYNVEFREYSLTGYTVAKRMTLNVLDYDKAAKAWMTDIINKTTTSGMTPFEKMDAVCEYLTKPGLFKYVTVHGEYLVSLASEPNSPYFISYRWDSCTSPAALCQFAELIGGFDDIHNCYGDYPIGSDDWRSWHYIAKVRIGNETRNYAVCPLSPTGEVGEIQKIDLTDLGRMRKFG
ncbi:hypothetical protein ACTQWG_07255 [Blautia sp. HCP3S3_H10_1]|uniref:hypothetical protein n=1 Tax=unclassified Blautia TaxID=2648079 RepID=UPI003F8E4813